MTEFDPALVQQAALTEQEREELVAYFLKGSEGNALIGKVERILAARDTAAYQRGKVEGAREVAYAVAMVTDGYALEYAKAAAREAVARIESGA